MIKICVVNNIEETVFFLFINVQYNHDNQYVKNLWEILNELKRVKTEKNQ